MTLQTQLILRALLEDPAQEAYGMRISAVTGLPSGTVQPILARLEEHGWLQSRWEDGDSHQQGRPCRHYYRLTDDGAERARASLDRSPIHQLGQFLGTLRSGPGGDVT